MSAQLYARAQTLSSALGVELWACLLLSAALIVVYMVVGGYVAVAYNDVMRALVMLIGLVALPAVALVRLGGLPDLQAELAGLDERPVNPLALGFVAAISFAGIGLGSPGQPHILVLRHRDHTRQLVLSGREGRCGVGISLDTTAC